MFDKSLIRGKEKNKLVKKILHFFLSLNCRSNDFSFKISFITVFLLSACNYSVIATNSSRNVTTRLRKTRTLNEKFFTAYLPLLAKREMVAKKMNRIYRFHVAEQFCQQQRWRGRLL